jgi:pilus assembly protein CpaB
MRRPVIFVALAALAAMLASVVVYSALKKREAEVQQAMARTVYIVVAAADLPLGSKIDPGQVKLARWSADAMPEGAFTSPGQVVGSIVKNQFVVNEPIVATKLFMGQKTAGVMPLLIPPGMRAVSVPVDEVSDIAGFVLPHTHVDILVALSGDPATENKPFSKIVLQNVEVLAVAQEVEKKKDEPELVKVITVLVTPQDAERLSLATRQGTLRLAMRNYTDSKVVLTSGSDVSQMLHAYGAQVPVIAAQPHHAAAPERPVKKFQVEIFRDGKSSESVSFVSQALAEPSHHDAAAAPEKTASAASAHGSMETAADGQSDASASHAKTASASAASTAAVEPASFAPKGKTIEIP